MADVDARPVGSESLLSVERLDIASRIGGHTRTIVSGIDLTVGRGETVGIVGESGSGKSMTARALTGLLPPGVFANGSAVYGGRNVLTLGERELIRLRGSDIGLVFQDPFTMLNPLLRCGDHVTETLRDARGHRLSRAARHDEAVRRLAEVGIDDPRVAQRYPFQLSGGMRQRVGIAAALAGDPQLLIADEPSTALDVTTQKDILALLKSLQRSRGMGLILITHDLRVAFSMCDRLYVLYAGAVLEVGPTRRVEDEPLHPYTLGLLLSEPPADRRLKVMPAIAGGVPEPDAVRGSCPFATRCRWVDERCTARAPDLASVELGRATACLRIDEIRTEMRSARRAEQAIADEPGAALGAGAFVHVQDLTKVFASGSGARRHTVRALDRVSLAFDAGASVGLVGESGSGKTTLGRCLVGLETPSEGRLAIDGIDAADYGRLGDRDRRRLRRTIQMIFQDPYSSLNPTRTVGATLQEALAAADDRRGGGRAAIEELLTRVGLPAAYAARKPVALSGGERQRVAIARALAVRPRVIVCDEPVSALDVSVQAQILNLLATLRRELGVGYLFITHDLAVVRQVVERVFVLYRGEVVEQGPVADVLDHPTHQYTMKLVRSVPTTAPGWLES